MIKQITLLIIIGVLSHCSTFDLFSQVGWVVQSSGTVNNLHAFSYLDVNVEAAVGNSGTVLWTTNGGSNWSIKNSGTPNHLFGIYLYNSNTCWISGDVGIILKTTNGGTNWVIQNSNTVYQLHQMQFIDANSGYCIGWYGTIVKTTNGGINWVTQNSGTTRNLLGLSFLNINSGYVVGLYGTILSTTNGGSNWNVVQSGTTLSLESVYFTSVSTGLVIGENGRVQKTTNSGISWTAQSSGTSNWLMSISTQNNEFSTLIGELGTMRKTSNGGLNWYAQQSNTGNYLNNVSFIDTNVGTAVGDYGTIIHTTTGGWLLPTAPSLSSPANGGTCISLIGTLSWSAIFPPVANYRVQISTNSNFTSTVIDTISLMNTSYVIRSGALSYNNQYYWRVMATNQVGAGPWSSVRNFTTTLATPAVPNLVLPPNNSSGQSLTPVLDWDSASNSLTYRLRLSTDSSFTTILIDTGGLSATQFTIPAGRLLNNVKYYWKVNGSNTCVTGNWSSTWNFTTLVTGLTNNSNQIPLVYKLYNNHPNPFNPVTQIKFDLPQDNFVIMKIYNLLGDEVRVLVSEFKKAGSYNYTFNSKGLASGIYIYKFTAGSYSDIKKMVLLK